MKQTDRADVTAAPIQLEPVAWVSARRQVPQDDHWGQERALIQLSERFGADALQGLAAFSHVEIVYLFHAVDPGSVVHGARHPRHNPDWPAVGIFAQRGKNRPNRLGVSVCRLLAVQGCSLEVAELDAIDGTPVLDIKPVMVDFLPRQPVREPAWCKALMADYWLPWDASA